MGEGQSVRKLLCALCTLLLMLNASFSSSAEEKLEDLRPAVDGQSVLTPVKNLRFATHFNEQGERRLRISWDRQAEAEGYFVLYSFTVDGGSYPNSKLLNRDQTFYEPSVLGSGVHTFWVYPIRRNMTCKGTSSIDLFVADQNFFPSMLAENQRVDYYTSANVVLGLERFQRILQEENLANVDDFQKVRKIHRVLCDMLTYSNDEADVFRSVIKGNGLCDAYARGFKILCDLTQVECRYIVGKARDGKDKEYESHAWNMVKLDGEYYNVDVTWDDISQNYLYFLVPDAELSKTHMAETMPRPKADDAKYMLQSATFSEHGIRLMPGEEYLVALNVQPFEATFRAKLTMSANNVADYTISGETLQIAALSPGVSELQMTDGERIFDTLRIEVAESATKIPAGEEAHKHPIWPRVLFLMVVLAVCGYGVYYYKWKKVRI